MSLFDRSPTSADESRPEANISPTSSSMKFPQILRRGSALDGNEKKDVVKGLTMSDQNERKSSLSLRLRRKKQSANDTNDYDMEAAERLGQLFFSLPSEIVTQIISHLTIYDIYNLRLTSRTFNIILNYNASVITQLILPQTLAPSTTDYIQPILYRIPTHHATYAPNLCHLLTMLRRQHAVDRQIYNLLAFVQMKIYMTRLGTRVLSISDNRSRLIDAFQRPAWFVTHFLEQYRHIVIHEHPTHTPSTPNCSSCPSCRTAASKIIATYPTEDIMPAYHFYQLTVEHLQIATRTPMAAGPLERRLRGWSKMPVTEENLAIFVVLGGIPEIRKVAMMQGSYQSRLSFVSEFVEKVREAVAVNDILADSSQNQRSLSMAAASSSSASGSGSKHSLASLRRVSTYHPTTPKSIPTSTPTASRSASVTSSSHTPTNPQESTDLTTALDPDFRSLTRDHIRSLPDITQFFYNVWKDRIRECAVQKEEIAEPYPWLQRVMAGTGLEFGHSRTPEPPLMFGASPL